MKNIVVIGSINTDLVFRTSKLPLPGETMMAKNYSVVKGGKGANQAIAVARAGGAVEFIAKIGNDFYGKSAKANLNAQNISTDYIFTDEQKTTGIAVILVDETTGQNSIIVNSGANESLTVSDIQSVESMIINSKLLLIQLETPIETVQYALKVAKSHGVKTILNPAPATMLSKELLQYVDIITPNETETEILTGINPDNEEKIEKAASALLENVNDLVIITLGSKGLYYKTKKDKGCFIPSEKVKAIDTTAAGDVFNGFFAAALLDKNSVHDAIIIANKAAAISVTRMGAQPSIPYMIDVNTHTF